MKEAHGRRLVAQLNAALGLSLSVYDFKPDATAVSAFIWPRHLQDAPGLILAYQKSADAAALLQTIEGKLPSVSGKIGFHGKEYLGLAQVAGIRASQLLVVAEALEDSVLLLVDQPAGALLVDCYRTSGLGSTSVGVQGAPLVEALVDCFGVLQAEPKGASGPRLSSLEEDLS